MSYAEAQEPALFSESSNPHGPGQGALAARASAKYVQEGVGSVKLMPGHPRAKGRNRKKLLWRLGEIRILTLHAPPSSPRLTKISAIHRKGQA